MPGWFRAPCTSVDQLPMPFFNVSRGDSGKNERDRQVHARAWRPLTASESSFARKDLCPIYKSARMCQLAASGLY
jgi:hypothetical protein